MIVLQRRRQFFGQGTVQVTFHGNGGQTAASDVVVVMMVKKGTIWSNIAKPYFLQSGTAKQQNGFTFIQGDDNTVVSSDFVVNTDVTVFASYTVIEIGFITHNGEILSAGRWVEKYGHNIFEPAQNSYGIQLIESHRGDLIEFMYFKISHDRAYAISTNYTDINGVERGSLYNFDSYTTTDTTWGGAGLNMKAVMEGVGYTPFLVDSRAHYQSYANPFLVEPPNFSNQTVPPVLIDKIMNWDDAKATCVAWRESLEGITDTQGHVGSPFFNKLYNMESGNIIGKGSFYVPSIPEINILLQKKNEILQQIAVLDAFRVTDSFTGLMYGYGLTYQGSSFYPFRTVMTAMGAGGGTLLLGIPILVSTGLLYNTLNIFGDGITMGIISYNASTDTIENLGKSSIWKFYYANVSSVPPPSVGGVGVGCMVVADVSSLFS